MWPPGTEVMRIKDPPEYFAEMVAPYGVDIPQRDVVYVVEASWLFFGQPAISLVGMQSPRTPFTAEGYDATYFAEVRRKKTDISIFTAMLKTDKVPEPA